MDGFRHFLGEQRTSLGTRDTGIMPGSNIIYPVSRLFMPLEVEDYPVGIFLQHVV